MCYRPPTRQISPYLSLSLEIKSYRIAASEEYLCVLSWRGKRVLKTKKIQLSKQYTEQRADKDTNS